MMQDEREIKLEESVKMKMNSLEDVYFNKTQIKTNI